MLHLAPDSSAAGTLRGVFPDVEIYFGTDPLSCGPAKEFTFPGERWFMERGAFWAEVDPAAEFPYERSQILDALRRGDDCAVWAGSTADDQLFLSWVCAIAPLFGSPRVHWVDCSDPGSRFPFSAVHVHNAEFLGRALPPRLLRREEIALYASAWNAWIAASPRILLDFVQCHSGTIIGTALRHLLNRYPLAGIGINGPELLLLKNIREHGPRMLHAIGWSLGDRVDDSADWFGDGWLFWRARRLASPALAHPLIQLSGDPTHMGRCEARLTSVGSAVLERKADALTLNGVEDQIGGVTLTSARGDVWVLSENGLENV
jgi:hypothetical protein